MSAIAYLDPATGSIIISAVVAGTGGVTVAMRSMMSKLRFAKNTDVPETDTDTETGSATS